MSLKVKECLEGQIIKRNVEKGKKSDKRWGNEYIQDIIIFTQTTAATFNVQNTNRLSIQCKQAKSLMHTRRKCGLQLFTNYYELGKSGFMKDISIAIMMRHFSTNPKVQGIDLSKTVEINGFIMIFFLIQRRI